MENGQPKIQSNLAMVGGIVNMGKDVNWQHLIQIEVTAFRILVRKMLTAQMLDI
jgi:hypothetical protein